MDSSAFGVPNSEMSRHSYPSQAPEGQQTKILGQALDNSLNLSYSNIGDPTQATPLIQQQQLGQSMNLSASFENLDFNR